MAGGMVQNEQAAQSHLAQSRSGSLASHRPSMHAGAVGPAPPAPFPSDCRHALGAGGGGGDRSSCVSFEFESLPRALHGISRGLQSPQSLPREHAKNIDPSPPSSHRPSFANMHPLPHICTRPFMQLLPARRGPQSPQSIPKAHSLCFAPGPPSSQWPSAPV